MKVLVTGCAGFIGFHVCKSLLSEGLVEVVGIDNLNSYYNTTLKQDRLKRIKSFKSFTFYQIDIKDSNSLNFVIRKHNIKQVIHLAAQAGVRYSIENPQAYVDSNISGFVNILESCRQNQVEHLVYASSSSVYGLNSTLPFSSSDRVDHPVSFYGATKKSNELMAHSYSYLYGIPTTGLRFFSVYGPWGRPDMAYFLFAEKIIKNEPILVFNKGKMRRDFTYIDDIVEGILRVRVNAPQSNPRWSGEANRSTCPYIIFNIGCNKAIELLHFIEILEKALGKKAIKEMLPMQDGDMLETFANMEETVQELGLKPKFSIEEGIERFVEWFRSYQNV